MGSSKLCLELPDGRKLGSLALEAAVRSALSLVFVVVRPGDSGGWFEAGFGTAQEGWPYRVISCPEADKGMAYSIRCGVEFACKGHPDAVVIMLADQPLVTAEWLDNLLKEFQLHPEADYVASSKDGRLMPPVLFSRSMFDELRQLKGDAGARFLLAGSRFRGRALSRPAFCFVDVDTPEDWAELLSKYSE